MFSGRKETGLTDDGNPPEKKNLTLVPDDPKILKISSRRKEPTGFPITCVRSGVTFYFEANSLLVYLLSCPDTIPSKELVRRLKEVLFTHPDYPKGIA